MNKGMEVGEHRVTFRSTYCVPVNSVGAVDTVVTVPACLEFTSK